MKIRNGFVIVLAICLVLALALPAAAQGGFVAVHRSGNLLRVNGALVDCDKYNIGDYNYFKLPGRDAGRHQGAIRRGL